MKKIINLLRIVFAILTCSIIGSLIIEKNDFCFYFFGYGTVTIVGNSMQPFFDGEDNILVKRCNENAVFEKGEIYIFEDDEDYVCHRLIDITKEGDFVFKGDNNTYNDALVRRDQIKAKYIKKVKNSHLVKDICLILANISVISLIFLLFPLIFLKKLETKYKNCSKLYGGLFYYFSI